MKMEAEGKQGPSMLRRSGRFRVRSEVCLNPVYDQGMNSIAVIILDWLQISEHRYGCVKDVM